MPEIGSLGSMRGVLKRGYGSAIGVSPYERGGNRKEKPNLTLPRHFYSTYDILSLLCFAVSDAYPELRLK